MNMYEFGTDDKGQAVIRTTLRGSAVLKNAMVNKGTSFTREEREALGIVGLLPSGVMSMNAQLSRVYRQFSAEPTDMAKHIYLRTMQDRNETLFYRLLSEHLEEMLPIVYTPTIGEAIQEYSHWFHRPRGVYLSIDRPEDIESALRATGRNPEDVDLVVATDSEGILGIGDQGVGGVAITIGKISLYVAAGGIHPYRAIPVVLDTGTDNLGLLSDPAYLGVRHARVRGQRYDEFIQRFVEATNKVFPNAMLHWEDFGAANAHRILDTYKNDYCTFNDDIQGTAAVVVAAIMSADRTAGQKLRDQKIVVHGAGTAGVGIADLLVKIMQTQGLSEQEARNNFYCLGSRGLLIEGRVMRDFQEPYARSEEEVANWILDSPDTFELADVIRNVRPSILIGTSAQGGSFTQQIISEMASHVERPIIMPLSNPTSKAEASPEDILAWTKGRALIATGSPFKPVEYGGTSYQIAQANNAFVFPGIGLGVITSGAKKVTEEMLVASAGAVADSVSSRALGDSLLPPIDQLRAVSAMVGLAVAEKAIIEGVATKTLDNPVQNIFENMWRPVYQPVEAANELTGSSRKETDLPKPEESLEDIEQS